ncbi:MAG: tRNA-dihydrouridine synthase [Methanobrevibacter sp.]|uniref:MJ0144 family RNA dihydrouridine synthase-like protein n=1 Tax=Methanobrevibacter sp. TaxID=66852 RepID=UPI0025FF68E3|nr:MJ0144 family RNA dihydrouridine synthase-like protein [Methanobrevibacter sp.]MBR0271109.1 tRNA-dihydrouridine synthase [Methanobrevibacter sp.]
MAGITDAEFLNKVIPYGFDVVTLGGYSLDEKTIEASRKIIERGRKEFHFEIDEVIPHIESEVNLIKNKYPDIRVSANVRSTVPEPIIEASKIEKLDIIEINCHCRQDEITAIGCGQEMLKRPDLSDYISQIVDGAESEVSVKIRANVEGIDTLDIAHKIEDAGADYLHLDAMDPNVFDADWKLLRNVCGNTDIKVIGNNSIDSAEKIQKMYDCGVYGFSIARGVISGNLNFNIADF